MQMFMRYRKRSGVCEWYQRSNHSARIPFCQIARVFYLSHLRMVQVFLCIFTEYVESGCLATMHRRQQQPSLETLSDGLVEREIKLHTILLFSYGGLNIVINTSFLRVLTAD